MNQPFTTLFNQPAELSRAKKIVLGIIVFPFFLPLFVIGGISICWTCFDKLRQQRKERFAEQMNAANRLVTWQECKQATENSSGLRVVLGCVVATVCLLFPLGAQQVRPVKDMTTEHNPALQLFRAADSLPIEFRADIQLNAIESAKLPAETNFETQLEQLFRDAENANFKYPVRAIHVVGGEPMERELTSALAFYNLDTLSIRIRIARQMLKHNRLKAKKELQEVLPQISAVSCESPLVPSLAQSYRQLGLLAGGLFDSDGKSRPDYTDWVLVQIQGITSASQLAPVAELLLNTTLTKNDLERLMVSYSSALRQLKTTDRELAAIEDNPDGEEYTLRDALRRLADRNLAVGIWSGTLLDSYRSFLLSNAAQTPCAEAGNNWSRIVGDFNSLARHIYGGQNVPTLDLHDLARNEVSTEHAHFHQLPETADIDQLFGTIIQIRTKEQTNTPAEHESGVKTLEGVYADFLNKVDAFDPAKAACEECAYFKKAKLLLIFFDQAPSRFYQSQILDRLTSVLSTSPLQSNWRVLWLFQVQLLPNFSRTPSEEQSRQIEALKAGGGLIPMLPSSLGPQILASMKQSSDFVMFMYASTDELFKPKFFAPYLN